MVRVMCLNHNSCWRHLEVCCMFPWTTPVVLPSHHTISHTYECCRLRASPAPPWQSQLACSLSTRRGAWRRRRSSLHRLSARWGHQQTGHTGGAVGVSTCMWAVRRLCCGMQGPNQAHVVGPMLDITAPLAHWQCSSTKLSPKQSVAGYCG